MQVIPAIDLDKGRSRVVYWPGAATGEGTPTDRPERIAERFVRLGAPIIHRADAIRLAFAAGATRVVLGMSVAEDLPLVRECVGVAGDWLAVGLDPRPERFAAFPWKGGVPTLEAVLDRLLEAGVRRFVLSHSGAGAELAQLGALARTLDADLLVAGGVRDLDGVRRVRDAGATGIILGEALLSGANDYPAALEAAT